MTITECDFNSVDVLQEILIDEWLEDLSFNKCVEFAVSSTNSFASKFFIHIVKKFIIRSTTYCLLSSERRGIIEVVKNTLSMGWLDSWYFNKLWSTKIISKAANNLFPDWFSSIVNVTISPYAECYLSEIDQQTPIEIAIQTFQRYLLSSFVNVVYEYVLIPAVCHPQGLSEINSIADTFGSLIIRPLGAYIGHVLYPHQGYGAFWGGLSSYLVYCAYLQRLYIKHIEDTWDNNDTAEQSSSFHTGDLENTYYKTLNVDESADEKEIKSSYRKLAREHHPDRHSQATPEVQRENEDKMKEVTSAYTNLVDPRKRDIYNAWLSDQISLAANKPKPKNDEPESSSPTAEPNTDTSTAVVDPSTQEDAVPESPPVDFSFIAKPVAAAALVFQFTLVCIHFF